MVEVTGAVAVTGRSRYPGTGQERPAATGAATAVAGPVGHAPGHLESLIDALGALSPAATESEAVDWIAGLERLKAACAAAQAMQTETLYTLRCADEASRGVPAADRGRGVAAEVALARRESPARGSEALRLARTLCGDMPRTRAALGAGAVSEYKASLMVKETSWLPPSARREVDEVMAERLPQLGPRRLAGEARAHAQRLDPAAAVRHTDRAVRERRVSVRPAPGGMAYLTALLPVQQAVACLANLRRSAATTVGTGRAAARTQDQVAADLLVERVTGQSTPEDVPAEVHLVMTDRALFAGDSMPAWLVGHGPVPAGAAREALRDTSAEVFLRRLYTDPEAGQLVGMDSRRREFGGQLRQMVILRDGTCRTPWCDAPVRHIDHATPFRAGGTTSFGNASGLCARCNYSKENPGWTHRGSAGHLDVTTPTGHRYRTLTGPVLPSEPGARHRRPGVPEVAFPDGTWDPLRHKAIPAEATDITFPPRPPEHRRVPVPAGISVPEARLALYLASAGPQTGTSGPQWRPRAHARSG